MHLDERHSVAALIVSLACTYCAAYTVHGTKRFITRVDAASVIAQSTVGHNNLSKAPTALTMAPLRRLPHRFAYLVRMRDMSAPQEPPKAHLMPTTGGDTALLQPTTCLARNS